jgi:hypothetical protein
MSNAITPEEPKEDSDSEISIEARRDEAEALKLAARRDGVKDIEREAKIDELESAGDLVAGLPKDEKGVFVRSGFKTRDKAEIEPGFVPPKHPKNRSHDLGMSKINGHRGQLSPPRRKRATKWELEMRAAKKVAVANMVAAWQEKKNTGHRHAARGRLRNCEYCNLPLPYKLKVGTRYHPECKADAALKRAAEIERNKVFQTEASIAQNAADADQRFYNYREVTAEMQRSAHRIGRDDVIFCASPGGVIVANDNQPLPEIRVIVFDGVEPRRVEMQVTNGNHTTRHPDIIDQLVAVSKSLDEESRDRLAYPRHDVVVTEPPKPPASTVVPIPRSNWKDGRGSVLEERLRHAAHIALLNDLLRGPERRVALCTIDDASYLPEDSRWEFRFKGDPGTGTGDDYEGVWPEPTPDQEAKLKDRRDAIAWVEKHQSKPAYTHPETFAGGGWRRGLELVFADGRRIDLAPPPPPVEHLFAMTG